MESVFDPVANLVDYLIYLPPSRRSRPLKPNAWPNRLWRAMDFEGLLAVELFLDTEGRILVNEVAPRTHNSGHHTIEANVTSQFEQHLRTVLDLPLGSTTPHVHGAMVNIVGTADAQGTPDTKASTWRSPQKAFIHTFTANPRSSPSAKWAT